MSTKRRYGDGCGIARALDIIGERWALLVVRELMLGPKRFTDLQAGMPGSSPNVLAMRLRELEETGVVQRRRLGPPVRARVYELTPWGQELESVLIHLGRWGGRSPEPATEPYRSADSLMLWQRSLFDSVVGADLDASYELCVDDDHFTVRVADGQLSVERGVAVRPDVKVEADLPTLTDVLKGKCPVSDAAASGRLTLTGDAAALQRLIDALSKPRPVTAA